MLQKIRDVILSQLSPNFTGEELAMIDHAVAKALKGYEITRTETLPVILKNEIKEEISGYISRKKSKGCQPGTLEQYKYVLKMFAIYSKKQLQDTVDTDVMEFLDVYSQYKKIGLRRKDGMRVILNGFFRYLTDTGKMKRNPMCTVDAIRFEKKVRESLSDIEFERLRRACKTPREAAIIEFLFATGCRVDETIRCNKSDIDYARRLLKVYGKGKKERFV